MKAINRLFLDSGPAVFLSPCHFHFERQCLDTEPLPWNSAKPSKSVDDARSHTDTHTHARFALMPIPDAKDAVFTLPGQWSGPVASFL